MQYIHGTTNIKILEDTIVILGNFDGIHIGHQKLFQVAKDIAEKKGLKTLVFSFYPHPTWVLGNSPKQLLMSREEKKEKIKQLGIDIYVEYPFSKKFSQLSALSFVTDIILNKLNGKLVVVGQNYYFGKDQKGNIAYLQELSKVYNFGVQVVDEVKEDELTVSSTYIRQLILDGLVHKAHALLGHPYAVTGIVVKGKQLGRTIGFPTINIIPDEIKVLPAKGAYITRVYILGKSYDGISNVGYNPTVKGNVKKVETHILAFSKDVYGQQVTVEFLEYIRPEIKFHTIEELVKQLNKDRLLALEYQTNDLQRKKGMI